MTTKGPRIVTLDIETAPLESYHWGLWEENIGVEQIKTEWTILSFSAKWLGDKKIVYKDTGGKGVNKVRDDKDLLKELWSILDEADIVVAQNGKNFDIKKINARLMMNGFGPYSPIKVVDTRLAARRHFGFTANKLAWLSEHLTNTQKSEHREFPGFSLWAECLKDNAKAWKEMKKYNCADTEATEQLYLKLRPWIENHPNVAVFNDNHKSETCPKCGSDSLQKRGFAHTQHGKYQRFQCKACQGWARSRTSLTSKEDRKTLLIN